MPYISSEKEININGVYLPEVGRGLRIIKFFQIATVNYHDL